MIIHFSHLHLNVTVKTRFPVLCICQESSKSLPKLSFVGIFKNILDHLIINTFHSSERIVQSVQWWCVTRSWLRWRAPCSPSNLHWSKYNVKKAISWGQMQFSYSRPQMHMQGILLLLGINNRQSPSHSWLVSRTADITDIICLFHTFLSWA